MFFNGKTQGATINAHVFFFLKQGNTRYKELNIKLNKETKNGKGKSWYMMQD